MSFLISLILWALAIKAVAAVAALVYIYITYR